MTRGQLCWECEYVCWEPAERAWSELTPGEDMHVYCRKDHWYLNTYGDTLADFRRYLLMAQTCPDFMPRESATDDAPKD